MNERIHNILSYITSKEHHKYRQDIKLKLSEEFSSSRLSDIERSIRKLERVLGLEKPVILPYERIVGLRTVPAVQEIYNDEEWEAIKGRHYIHEKGNVCNISPNYAETIQKGLEQRRSEALLSLKECEDKHDVKGIEFLKSAIRAIDAVEGFADRYLEEAQRTGNEELANILKQVPKHGARTFHEALQSFRIIHFALWSEGEYHNTVGRFDQYMYPYLKVDMEDGRLDYDSALELLEEFFISFNKDSDLYPGVQQGDNGQSLVLGGVDGHGNDAYNLLSELCLKASCELKLIDPKINLRVHKGTSMEIYQLGTELTKQGLGFPQYSNDDIVIPGLVEKGYDIRDARNYVVAACWEFIIPGKGMDIPNIAALSFPKVVDKAIHKYLRACQSFGEFMDCVADVINQECHEMAGGLKNLWMVPAPFMSVLMDGCTERARDISEGSKYNNYGIHGTGLSTASDSIAVIKKYVYDDSKIDRGQLIDAIDANFQGYDDLLAEFKYDAPKAGNDDYSSSIAFELLDKFAEALKDKRNEMGGCFRAGTGSAMYYIWHAREIGASPNGRKKGEPFEANMAPALSTRVKGPVSIIKSFTRGDLKKTINGGPLTIELHDTVFRNEEGLKKVSMLVKSFMDMGGHQLQLNAVNREKLLDAQKHPEQHRHLIVRVWGWSAYFVELDKEYQNHIIQRVEMMV